MSSKSGNRNLAKKRSVARDDSNQDNRQSKKLKVKGAPMDSRGSEGTAIGRAASTSTDNVLDRSSKKRFSAISASSSNSNEGLESQPPEERHAKFMKRALKAAKQSKNPVTQVGACIVNPDNEIVGVGYNHMPNGCKDDEALWDLKEKKWYVCHAELNAVMNKTSKDVKGCTMYVTLFPCNECAKLIIQAGIRQIFYNSSIKCLKKKYKGMTNFGNMALKGVEEEILWKQKFQVAKDMLEIAGIECEKYVVSHVTDI